MIFKRRISMSTTQRMVVAVFDDNTQAEQAANALQNAGFSPDQLRFAGSTGSTSSLGEKIKSLFTGQRAGSAYDDLVDLGVSQDDASYYQQQYEAGHSILAVLAADRMQDATDILARYGGYSAANRGVTQTTNYAGGGATQPTDYGVGSSTTQTSNYASTGVQETTDYGVGSSTTQAADYTTTGVQDTGTEGEQAIKLREEQLRVQKQPVETGEARLRKDVVTEQRSMDVPVTREEVYIERRPASGQPSDTPIGEGETYRVPVREEQVTVEKQPVVREEVALGKRQVQDTQQVSETVRREEARVEQSGDVNIQGSNVQDIDQTDTTNP
jgi:uncharacterized protein (TIGR02271 family)